IPQDVLERVMDGLYPATVESLAGQPDQMLFAPDDLLRYAEGDLAGFLLKLDKQQEPLTAWALSGPTLVKGGPGSGKSTVALYRVRELVEHHLQEHGALPQVLFTTYTNALINFSESLLRSLLRDTVTLGRDGKLPRAIRVSTLHKTAAYIAHRSGEEFSMAGSGDRQEALHAARAALQPRGLGDAAKIPLFAAVHGLRDDYLLDEFDWVIEGQNCQELDDYLAAERAGRGIAFPKNKRTAVWKLYEAYRQYLLDQDLYTWGQLILFALDRVKSGEFGRRWDYVIVDEAQDLPPAALALAVELCREPSGVFLTADANQSLYNRGFRWGSVHDQLQVKGRSRILGRNYRSTRQIAAAAGDIVAGVPEMDREAIEQEYVHSGLPPLVYAAAGSTDQWRWIAQQIFESARELRLPVNAATVLVSSSTIGEPLAQALREHGLPARFMNSRRFDLDEPGIKVTTLHAAKGLEFPIVVIAHVEAGRLPRETSATDPEELAAHDQAQRRLFYVGCTRAMRHLFVTYDRDLPSPFVADMTAEHWQRV
ncbi:MAG: 3'-5' exonuclease, partial [Candidatus Promineifilaceae bacterium]